MLVNVIFLTETHFDLFETQNARQIKILLKILYKGILF